jgi:hypothetical protein
MKLIRMILTVSAAGMLAAAPLGLAQARDAHDHGTAAKKARPAPAKKIVAATLKKPGHAGHMPMMRNCAMMQAGHGGRTGMRHHAMMSGPLMSQRMQWHHNMMMWHHQMMHGPSPMHPGS